MNQEAVHTLPVSMIPLGEINGFPVRPGLYDINGATLLQNGVNFTVHTNYGTGCSLLLFHREEEEPYAVLPFPEEYKIGKVYSMIVFGLNIEEFEYAYCVDGPWDPARGLIFDKKKILLDPYAKAVTGMRLWGEDRTKNYHARVVKNNFDWGDMPQSSREMSELVHQLKSPFWTHNSETRSEVDGCMARHGMSPTACLDSLGLFDFGGGGYHCVWFTDDDVRIFAEKGLWAVTCPCSNAKLASGIAPLGRFEKRGVKLAIGTDGPASNNALDMFREMYLACVLQKLERQDAAACPAEGILYAACSGGARAMGLENCDCLAEGKAADLAVINMNRPNMRPVHAVAKNLVYSGTRDNVRLTMVAGRILYENGEFFVGEDPGRIYAEAEKYTRELIGNGN